MTGTCGVISGPRDVGVTGAGLDRLIAQLGDYFAGRGQAGGWQARAHEGPADLSASLRAAGFAAGEERAVLTGVSESGVELGVCGKRSARYRANAIRW
jgi:hypothetical protein